MGCIQSFASNVEALAKPPHGSPQVRPPLRNPPLVPPLGGEAVPSRFPFSHFSSGPDEAGGVSVTN
jgi:hypothetical protein